MAKPSFGKRVVWRLEAFAYDLVCLCLKPFSFSQISGFGGFVVGLIGPLTSKRKIAETGLKIAFPNADPDTIATLLKAQWNNTGRTFGEFPILHRLDARIGSDDVTIIGADKLEARIKSGIPAVFIAGHFANWEVMAMVLTQSGLPVQTTYRPMNNPHVDKRVRAQRMAYGTKLMIPKSGPKGAKQLMEALKNGESIALMNDQKFNQGMSVPFFGKDAMTAPGPTRLAIGAKVPLIPLSVTRDKSHFTVTIHDPIKLDYDGDRNSAVKAGVSAINAFMEDRVRENPEQWFWVHRRWPKDLYKTS